MRYRSAKRKQKLPLIYIRRKREIAHGPFFFFSFYQKQRKKVTKHIVFPRPRASTRDDYEEWLAPLSITTTDVDDEMRENSTAHIARRIVRVRARPSRRGGRREGGGIEEARAGYVNITRYDAPI